MSLEVCFANETIVIDEQTTKNMFIARIFCTACINNILISLIFLIIFEISKIRKNRRNQIEIEKIVEEFRQSPPCFRKIRGLKGGFGCESASSPINTYTPPKFAHEMVEEDLRRLAAYENRSSSSQEDPSGYTVGGYMPVKTNDNLGGKYEVVRKLGFGQFSTVWLCHNQITDEYAAIKISKANQKQNSIAREEIKLFQCIDTKNINHLGYNNVVRMLDFFTCHSVNGPHTALVLEVMGPSLLHLIRLSENKGIELRGVRRIITQVLRGLMYLHEECKIIHTDIKPENILIKTKDSGIRRMVDTTKRYKQLGIALPKTYIGSNRWEDDSSEDSEVSESSKAASCPDDPFLSDLVTYRRKHPELRLLGPMWIESNIEVKIADMGNACFRDRKYSAPAIQTRQYRAIEVLLDAGWDCPADLWSVGCLAFELATGEFLFYPRASGHVSLDMDHLALIWETLGGIPDYVATRGQRAHEFFTEKGTLRHLSKKIRIWKVEDVLVEKYKWRKVNAILFAGFINSLIEPDQSLRCTAREALNSAWIHEE